MNFELLDTAASAAASAAQGEPEMSFQMFGVTALWIVAILVVYFLFLRPQNKKRKEEEELRNSVEIGDDVTTIGGIVGRVISMRDDDETIVIETGSDKTRMRFKKWAISSVDTPEKQPKKAESKKPDKDEANKKAKKDRKKDDED